MEATQLLRAVQQGLDLQQQLMEGIRQQRVQMQQQEQAQAQMQQLQQAWCSFNSNSRNQQLKMRGFAHPHCDRFCPTSIRMEVRCATSFSVRVPKGDACKGRQCPDSSAPALSSRTVRS